MKIGDQAFDDVETKTRQDKNIRLTESALQHAVDRGTFERAQRRCAHRRYAPALRAGLLDRSDRLLRDVVPLAVHHVIGKIFHSHRLKRARADVQRDVHNPNTLRAQCIEQRFIEMQACRRRGYGAGLRGEYGLIATLIVAVRGVRDVRRQRHRTISFQQIQHAVVRFKSQTEQFPLPFHHRDAQFPRQQQFAAGPRRFAGAHVGEDMMLI